MSRLVVITDIVAMPGVRTFSREKFYPVTGIVDDASAYAPDHGVVSAAVSVPVRRPRRRGCPPDAFHRKPFTCVTDQLVRDSTFQSQLPCGVL